MLQPLPAIVAIERPGQDRDEYFQDENMKKSGASQEQDPARLFNSSLDGNTRRAIDIHEGEEVEASAFKALVRQAGARNSAGKAKPRKKAQSCGIPSLNPGDVRAA